VKRCIFILAILVSFLNFRAYAYDDDDGAFQIWLTTLQEFKVKDRLKIALEEEFRWGDQAREFYYQHYDLGLIYILNRYWDIGGGYRHIYELSKNKFKEENEPYITATLKLKMGDFSFNSRNRFEYRHFDYKADSGRYRNKFTLKYFLKIARFEAKPFISDEIFFGFGGKSQFNQNRLSSGIEFEIIKNMKGEIYYMLVTVKRTTQWFDANVLGAKFKIIF
jgi:hypothetical protein